MNSALAQLLRQVSVEKDDCCQKIYTGANKWLIPLSNQKDFWLGYCQIVREQTFETQTGLNCTEQASGCFPLIGNFQFRFEVDDDSLPDISELLPEQTLAFIAHCFQQVIVENFQLEENKAEMICCVMISQPQLAVGENDLQYCYVSVRFQFPYSRTDLGQQKEIRRKVLSKIRRNGSRFFSFGPGFIHDMERAFEIPSSKIPLYGSALNLDDYACELKYIWTIIEESDLENDEVANILGIEEMCPFYANNNELVTNGFISEDDLGCDIESFCYEEWLPLFFSIRYFKGQLIPVQRKAEVLRLDMFEDINPDDNYKLALRFFSLIKPERFLSYSDWIVFGKICRTCSSAAAGLDLWIDQTKNALRTMQVFEADFMVTEGTLEHTCNGLFRSFQDRKITVKTLAWIASQDNPSEWNKWRTTWIENALINALSEFGGTKGKPSDNGLAKVVHRFFWLEFAFDGLDWKLFREHRWIPCPGAIDLSKRISDDLQIFVGSYSEKINNRSKKGGDLLSEDERDETMKKILKVKDALRNVGPKGRMIKEASTLFLVDNFNSYLDDDLNILGVRNGVIVTGETDFEFREGRPEDYVSMQCLVEYVPEYTWEDKKVKELTTWINQVFTDKHLCRHFEKLSASILEGGNQDKIFPIFTGSGDNSKSMIIKLFEATFGPYCIKFPASLLVENPRNASSSGPNPALARARGARAAFVDEPEDDCSMNKGAIKRFTGGDSFFARLLNQNGGDHKASFVMFLVCNDVPVIANADGAIKRRTRIFPFLSKWVETGAPETKEEQLEQRLFPQDPHFGKKISSLAPAFLWLACQKFSLYRKEGLRDPEIVKRYTQDYWDSNDVYSHFIVDCLQLVTVEGVPSELHFMTISDLYKQYKEWMRRSFPSSKIPDCNIFRMNMIRKWGNMSGSGWFGVTLARSNASFAPAEGNDSSSSSSSPVVLSQPPKKIVVESSPLVSKPPLEKRVLEVKGPIKNLEAIEPTIDCC